MILDHLGPFAGLVVIGPPMVGVLRAYSLDRFRAGLGTTVWRTGALAIVAAFLLFATPWGMPLLAQALAANLPDLWEEGLASGYRVTFTAVYLGFPVTVGLVLGRRLDTGSASRRSAVLAVVVALFVFLALIYPLTSQGHCPPFQDGLILDGFCVTEG